MTIERATSGAIDWRLTEQRFRGTPEQVASEVEDLILKLVACRQFLDIVPDAVAPAAPPTLWRRLFAMLGLVGAIWWVGSKPGTW